jgi:RNA polymerase sigma-70 factor, ECF subfamily
MRPPAGTIQTGLDRLGGNRLHRGDEAMDDVILGAISEGEFRKALEALVCEYQHAVVGFCTQMLGAAYHGQEVAQEVFLGAYQAMPRFRQQASIRTWLFAIARKQCLKALRQRYRWQQLCEEHPASIRSATHREPPIALDEQPDAWLERVRQGLGMLDQSQRALLLMRYDTGLTLIEMAHILGVSEAGVRRRLIRALQDLRREVMDHDP